jgi:hypothetical protein
LGRIYFRFARFAAVLLTRVFDESHDRPARRDGDCTRGAYNPGSCEGVQAGGADFEAEG